MPRFGMRDADHEARRERRAQGGAYDDPWIKGFQDENRRPEGTTIRILEPVEDWAKYLEHYSDAGGFFPCANFPDDDPDGCVGCNSPVEKTAKRSWKWAVNCLDADDRLVIHKFGAQQRDRFQAKEKRLGDVTDRDYVIFRLGTGFNDTQYTEEPASEPYERNVPAEVYDVYGVLANIYDKAASALSGEYLDEAPAEPEPEPQPQRQTKPPARQAPPRAAAPQPEPEPEPEPEAGVPDFSMMRTQDLREWLKERGYALPKPAPRSRLISMAHEAAGEPIPF